MNKTGGAGLFQRRWLTLAEAAGELETDEEGLLQAFGAGAAQHLPVYVLSGKPNFSGSCYPLKFAHQLYEDGAFRESLCDGDGRIALHPARPRAEEWERWFQLIGAFRIFPASLKRIAREREMPVCRVAPGSWWAVEGPVEKNEAGDPAAGFHITLYDRAAQSETPVSFTAVRFKAEDVRAAVAIGGPVSSPEAVSSDARGKWPWGDHDTEFLRMLEAAGKRFWSNYDPGDPTTAETNEKVAAWLLKEKYTESNSRAQAIASMLRADGLKSGPRK